MKKLILLIGMATALVACGHKEKTVREQLDSMKAAARMEDSLRVVHLRDSLPILQQSLQEKTAALQAAQMVCTRTMNPEYQDQGEWYARLANNREGRRTTLDAFMTDDGAPTLRSTVSGRKSGSHQLVLSSGAEELMAPEGDFYDYDADGHHELLTYTGRVSLDLFDFIQQHTVVTVRQGSVSYILNDSDRKALLQVYTLALAWDAQRRAEFDLKKAQNLLADWHNQHPD